VAFDESLVSRALSHLDKFSPMKQFRFVGQGGADGKGRRGARHVVFVREIVGWQAQDV
jgi:hypothetical protein